MLHADPDPSAWVRRWSALVPEGGRVLDVACGSGRHVAGWRARAARASPRFDRDAAALAGLAGIAAEVIVADIESAPRPCPPLPFRRGGRDPYLWRALLPTIVGSVADGGVLVLRDVCPRQPDRRQAVEPRFPARTGELLRAVAGLRVIAYEDGFIDDGAPRFVQSVAAVREAGHGRASQTAPLRALTPEPRPARRLKSADSEEAE